MWEVVALLRDFGSEAELAQAYELTPGQIRIALAYYKEFRDEIDDSIARGRRSEEELLGRYPFIQTFEKRPPVEGSEPLRLLLDADLSSHSLTRFLRDQGLDVLAAGPHDDLKLLDETSSLLL